ncbi:MAG: outer membrane lipoprotein-sorting protein [bacterium]|nr:outer membrane lipoprotein-sorting protein [bacterium]
MYLQKTKRPMALLLCGAFALASGAALTADDAAAEKKGLAIAREADRRDLGWKDSTADMQMILRNRSGQESRREMRARNLEVKNDGDKSLVVFDRPRDVKGTAFLTYSRRSGPDDQWLYLPSLKRVKRIASNNKSGPFMGSEFAYEDISSQEVEKYSYKFLREEDLNGVKTNVVARYPVDRSSGYKRQLVWIDQDEYRIRQIVFYDRKNAKLKTLSYESYRQYLGKYWRALELRMLNHQSGKSTVLSFANYKFRTGLRVRDFDQASLKRIR